MEGNTMEVEVSIESERYCGYRKPDATGVGIYLMGPKYGEKCERLPFPLSVCSVCGEGIRFSRNMRIINPSRLFGKAVEPVCTKECQQHDHESCPMCNPEAVAGAVGGVMWAGQKFYTPDKFNIEAAGMGISKKISSVPKAFQIGVHHVYLAHKKAVLVYDGINPWRPGVFMVFKPTHIDLVIEHEHHIPLKAIRLKEKHGDNARIVKVIPEENE
jgi:hypothetical protein